MAYIAAFTHRSVPEDELFAFLDYIPRGEWSAAASLLFAYHPITRARAEDVAARWLARKTEQEAIHG